MSATDAEVCGGAGEAESDKPETKPKAANRAATTRPPNPEIIPRRFTPPLLETLANRRPEYHTTLYLLNTAPARTFCASSRRELTASFNEYWVRPRRLVGPWRHPTSSKHISGRKLT